MAGRGLPSAVLLAKEGSRDQGSGAFQFAGSGLPVSERGLAAPSLRIGYPTPAHRMQDTVRISAQLHRSTTHSSVSVGLGHMQEPEMQQ
jgi:hypothetical protein